MLNLRATNWNTRLKKLLAEHSTGSFKDFFFFYKTSGQEMKMNHLQPVYLSTLIKHGYHGEAGS